MALQSESLGELLAAMRPSALGSAKGIQAGFEGFEQGRATAEARNANEFKQKLQQAGIVPGSFGQKAAADAGVQVEPDAFKEGLTPEALNAIRGGSAKAAEGPLSEETIDASLAMIDPSYAAATKALVKGLPATQGSYAIRSATAQDTARKISFGQPDRAAFGQALKDMNVQKTDFAKGNNALQALENAANTLGDMESGVFGQLKGRLGVSYGQYAADPAVTKALGQIDQQLGALARGPFAERGVLTDDDVQRVRRALGAPWLPKDQKRALIGALRGKLAADTAAAIEVAAESAFSPARRAQLNKEAAKVRKDSEKWLKMAGISADDPIPDIAAQAPEIAGPNPSPAPKSNLSPEALQRMKELGLVEGE